MDAASPAMVEVRHSKTAPIGAALAATICLLIAIVGSISTGDLGWVAVLILLPFATYLAWRSADTAATVPAREAVWIAVGLAVRTVFLSASLVLGASLLIIFGVGLASAPACSGMALSWFGVTLVYGLVALLICGALGSILAMPVALLWVALLRVATR